MPPGAISPKNFLFISYGGLAGDLAWQIIKEGHNVKSYIRDKEEREVANGFVPKVSEWRSEIPWADVIIFDDVLGLGKVADKLRKQGKYVVGGTQYTDELEDNRTFGQEELKKYGIPIIPYQDFSSFDDAILFVRKHPAKYVIKPSGEVAKGFLFVGEEEDGRDVLQVLNDYKNAWGKKGPRFQLQKRINGVEIAIGAFFNGKEFIYPINVNFEHKKLFPGNLGPSTGEMGTTMFWSGPNKIFNLTLKKIEGKLAEVGYVGYIDINCMVNGQGIYPLEWTSRFGYPTISIQQEGMITPIGQFLFELASGKEPVLKTKIGFQIGVRIVVPPFPFRAEQTFQVMSKDSIVYFKKPTVTDGIHIEDVKLVNGEWVVTGSSGVVLIVCGTGQTMKQAQEQAYSRIKSISIPHMYYRKDIGDRWYEDSDRLHAWGYLREM
ncbi:phosphoribosylamine--glycine ligase [Candidatus Peregrinibacteria bacterium]|nr:phosphoribosylamine--glycine ligase [Candidatus Peregrinibacteria bacterium]